MGGLTAWPSNRRMRLGERWLAGPWRRALPATARRGRGCAGKRRRARRGAQQRVGRRDPGPRSRPPAVVARRPGLTGAMAAARPAAQAGRTAARCLPLPLRTVGVPDGDCWALALAEVLVRGNGDRRLRDGVVLAGHAVGGGALRRSHGEVGAPRN